MPLDLNQFDIDTLTERIAELKPGQALISNDGQNIRRRHNTTGFDCGVGLGGYGSLRAWKPEEAAKYMLRKSAASTDDKSLGGAISYPTIEAAVEAVVKSNAKPAGPSPALLALRKFARNVGTHSYRTRAQKARELMSKGDIGGAVEQVEAIKSHAAENGRFKDVTRAKEVLHAINEHHEYETAPITARDTSITIVTLEGRHTVYQDGIPKSVPGTRKEAEQFKRFLERQVGKAQTIAEITKEEQELPSALREDSAA